MAYRLIPYTEDWQAAVAECNARLNASHQAPFLLPAQPTVAPDPSSPVARQHHLAVDDSGEVRGGCLLQVHPGWVDGEEVPVANLQSPLSEGLFDSRFAGVGPWMIREAVRRYPFLYCVGMGGEQLPFPRLLRALKWHVEPVPFFFRVLAGRSFLANMRPLREHPRLRPIAHIGGAVPFLPDWGAGIAHRFRTAPREPTPPSPGPVQWTTIRSRYTFAVERTEAVLGTLYPASDATFHRLELPGALAILRINQFANHRYFGNLRVATLVEAICELEAARPLLRAALQESRKHGAELLVTNQSAPELQRALQDEGWFSFRSNYLVALSPVLASRVALRPFYVNRGDGDGLLNL